MLKIDPLDALSAKHVVLGLSAHCDDIAIGAGALLLRMRARSAYKPRIVSIVFTGGDDPVRFAEEQRAAEAVGVDELHVLAHRDTLLPNHWDEIKEYLLGVRRRLGAENIGLVLCPTLEDRHQDHRVVAENAWRVFRDHLILEYEIPLKYEGDVGKPNLFLGLSEAEANLKLDILMNSYPSRVVHKWWRRDTLAAPMRLRGVECNHDLAEAYYARKLVL